MNITAIFLLAAILPVSANSWGQITLSEKNTPLPKVFKEIERQSGYDVIYTYELLEHKGNVTVNIKNASLAQALDACLTGKRLSYRITNKTVVIVDQTPASSSGPPGPAADPIKLPVSGTVRDPDGQPIANVSIMIKGTSVGTTTDGSGKFSIQTEPGQTLVISYVGYESQEIRITDEKTLIVRLKENSKSMMDQAVVIGYGTIKKVDLTGAVAVLESKDISTHVDTKIIGAMQGKVAGVTIEAMGGDPGSDMRIQIRGAGSLSNNAPLVLIDGVPGTMSMVNPTDVKSVEVLKDASASAIYGSRAANGVVLVETKTGGNGDVRIGGDVNYGVQRLGKKLHLLNAEQWRKVNTDARAEAGLPPADFASAYDGLPLPTKGTDWQDAMYVAAPIAKYSISANGGSKNLKFSAAFGYIDQEGIVQKTKYKELNLHIKTDFTKGKFKFSESLFISRETRNMAPRDAGGYGNVIENAVLDNPNSRIYYSQYSPAQQAYTPDQKAALNAQETGLFGLTNNVIQLLNLNTNQSILNRVFLSTYGQYEILPGLTYKLSVGASSVLTNSLFAQPAYFSQNVYATMGQTINPTGEVSESNNRSDYSLIQNTLNYEKEFGRHRLNLLAGQSAEKNEYRDAGGAVFNLPQGISVLGAGSATPSVTGTASASRIASYFGRAIYSYDDRYIFTATVRRDGSSRFSDNNKYGTFPSFAGAWNVSNESFLKNNPAISLLKLRASYGVLGNQDIGDYQFLGSIQPAYTMTIGAGSNLWTGSIEDAYPAANIKWESTATSNFGADLSLWKGKLDFTFDYFTKTTTDLLLQIPIPLSVGSGSKPYGNAGKLSNKGYEMLLAYSGGSRDFNFKATATFTQITNKVVELATYSQQLAGAMASIHGGEAVNYTKPGYPIYSFFLIQTDGIFRTPAEVAAHSKDGKAIQKNAKPGDIRFKDANNDGVIDANDRVYSGSPFPKFEYGFRFDANWKMFELSLLLQGTQGNKIYNAFRTYTESSSAVNNYTTKVLNSFTYNPNGNYPRLILSDPNGNGADNSNQYLEDGSYLRLKTLTLGFNFPKQWLNKAGISNTKFYAGAQNLFTITSYQNYNPDIGGGGWQGSGLATRGIDYSDYPLARSFFVGVQFTF